MYTKSFLIVTFIFSSLVISSQNVGINTTGAAPAATNLFEVLQTSTTANTVGIYSSHSGAISGTGYGIWAQKTGASTTNVAGYYSASGATNNYALLVPSGGGNVGIGTEAPSDCAILDIDASDKGILIPRVGLDKDLTEFAPIDGIETDGLMVYNTTDPENGSGTGFFYWSTVVSEWIKLYDSHSGGGYTLQYSFPVTNFVDIANYYFGEHPTLPMSSSIDIRAFTIPKTGVIKSCTGNFFVNGTLASAEAAALSLIKDADYSVILIDNNILLNSSSYIFNSSLEIKVVEGDKYAFIITGPTYITNPTSVYGSVTLFIE